MRRSVTWRGMVMVAVLLTAGCTSESAGTTVPATTASITSTMSSTPAASSTTSTPQAVSSTTASPATVPTTTTTKPAPPTTAGFPAADPSEPAFRARVTVTTTSDWMTLRLVSGAQWHDPVVTQFDPLTLEAGPHGDMLALRQSAGSAEAGNAVGMTVDLDLTGLDPSHPLVFEIERGHTGSTRVDVAAPGLEPAVLTWSGTTDREPNARRFEVSPMPFLGPNPNTHTVIAQINFWFYGPGFWGGFQNEEGEPVTPFTPLLGEYEASDPDVIRQQIEWAVEYGVDAFSVEWTTPRGTGCCGSMEDTLDDVFLTSPHIHKIRWVIFYDFILRIGQTEELDVDMSLPLDFDDPQVYDTFVYDFGRFAEKYFDHPQYLTIDGRPVIYIWATNSYIGDFAGAMRDARAAAARHGFDVFIVGDEVTASGFDPSHAALFDGSSTFTFLIPGIDGHALADVGDATQAVDEVFTRWRGHLDGLTVAGRDDLVNFQPGWAPQYDETHFRVDVSNPLYVPATSREQVVEMAEMIRSHAEPVGSSGQRLIWLNTWNNWAEGTTVEPTAALGPRYPAGNYQFDLLEINREVFGAETFFDSPIP